MSKDDTTTRPDADVEGEEPEAESVAAESTDSESTDSESTDSESTDVGPTPAEESDEPGSGEPEDLDAGLRAAEDRYLRLMAEFDNFRRRTRKEQEQWAADALGGFLADLLPVLDSIELARQKSEDAPEAVKEGLTVTLRQLETVLDAHGIERIDPTGEPFDPRFHEAFTRMPSDEHPAGTVVMVMEKGYTIAGRLLRPARVAVAAGED